MDGNGLTDNLKLLEGEGRQNLIYIPKETDLKLPLVVRLEGNNVEAGRVTLAESGISLITASSLAEAAQKSVEAAK